MNLAIVLQSSASGLLNMLPMLLIFVIMYFFFLRPTIKKQKDQNNFLGEIKKGDEVVTTSGMIGRIDAIEGDVVTLQVDPKTYIRFTKAAISKELTEGNRKSVKA